MKVVPGAFAFTILRDPVDAFESWYGYTRRDLALGMNISEFVETKATGMADPTGGRNKQLIDLGINMKGLEDEKSLKKKLVALEQQFDQILILEKLEEGLVLLAHSLCWPLNQVVSTKLNARMEENVSQLNLNERKKLRIWLWQDVQLYERSLKR